jgi:DNA-binding IclR family transcriptional regulator
MAIGHRSKKSPILNPPAQPNRSLVGGLECLEYLVAAERPVGSREVAREMNLEHTRANRLLGTLAFMGLAERTPDRKYVAGPALHVLAAMSLRGSRLLGAATAHLVDLGSELPDFSVALGVLWKRHVVYLYFAGPGEEPQVAIASRDLFPAEESSIGHVLLAARTSPELGELYPQLSSAERKRLRRAVADAKKRGYALLRGRTLGVPVGRPAVAGVAVAGKVTARNRPALVSMLRETAALIAAGLGQERL